MKTINISEFEELCSSNHFNFFIVQTDDSSSFDFEKTFSQIYFRSGSIVLRDNDNYLRIKSVRSISVDDCVSDDCLELRVVCDDISHIFGEKLFSIIAKHLKY